MKSFAPIVGTAILALLIATVHRSAAHDPYEITSVVYVRSNAIELFVEMEFPAGMVLAGQKPVRDMAVQSQFEAASPRLWELAGGFFTVTAGNNVVRPIATNVTLGVEDHIRFEVTFAPSPFRPLRFIAAGLGASGGDNPYGTSLTVLDMVHQKVLGQSTLFAGSPAAEFPPNSTLDLATTERPATDSSATALVENPATNTSPVVAVATPPRTATASFSWLRVAFLLAILCGITFLFFKQRE